MSAPPGLLISAPASGTGKTTVALGLMRAFSRAGLAVQPFKNGPDYIDPAFHAAACGRAAFNLDLWAMPEGLLRALAGRAEGADLVIAEGSMGLFDGVARPGATGRGASADLAAFAGWPVVLVLDVSGQAQTAGAVALGLARLRAGVRVAGVIANRVASPRQEAMVREGLAEAGLACFGCLPRNGATALPERHLGLVQAGETADLAARLEALADLVAAHLDLGALRAAAGGGSEGGSEGGGAGGSAAGGGDAAPALRPPGQRVALARDAAFSFAYPHLLEGWRAAGAEILPFSPLADEAPDASADVAWLPGGYPELHAGRLAANARFRAGLNAFGQTRPVHGECGGYMAMGAALIDREGAAHEMAGLLGLVTSYAARRMHLGYRAARLHHPIPGLAAGALARGHEFHYSTILAQPDAPLAAVADAAGAPVPETGSVRVQAGGGRATGSFFHLISEA